MVKRLFDISSALLGLALFSPFILFLLILIISSDGDNPIYVAKRVGKDGRVFRMYKLRTMHVLADQHGSDSTTLHDTRVTEVGKTLRKYKLDELMQLINVLIGQMSIVGPRPNTPKECEKYSKFESVLLFSRPGITDLASIVFSNEANILQKHGDPDWAYNAYVRPLKSRLGVWYVRNQTFFMDLCVVGITLMSIVSRPKALEFLKLLLIRHNAPPKLIGEVEKAFF